MNHELVTSNVAGDISKPFEPNNAGDISKPFESIITHSSREKYIRKHYGHWKCESCLEKETSVLAHNEMLTTPNKQLLADSNTNNTPSSSSLLNLNNLNIDTNKINTISGEIIVTNQVLRSINTPTNNIFLSPNKPKTFFSSDEISPIPTNHPLSPFTSTSKHDQVALLISLLTKNNVSIEDLVKMSEDEQKALLISLVNHANTRGGKTFESCKGWLCIKIICIDIIYIVLIL